MISLKLNQPNKSLHVQNKLKNSKIKYKKKN